MEAEFSDLAHQILNFMPDANGCLIVARDGHVLGAFPSSGVKLLEPMSSQLARLTGIKRAALEFSGSVWVFLGRPLYAVVATGQAPAEPTGFLARFEDAVLAAENSEAPPAKAKPRVPALAAAGGSAKTLGSSPKDAETEEDEVDPLELAQQFSSLFADQFGDEPGNETDEAAGEG